MQSAMVLRAGQTGGIWQDQLHEQLLKVTCQQSSQLFLIWVLIEKPLKAFNKHMELFVYAALQKLCPLWH